tara:strand:- start:2074 stop:2592 length:519 start_codon:yes stop_codon:yes gene_type:complete
MTVVEKLKEKKGIQILLSDSSFSEVDSFDWQVSVESTSDGYELWIVKEGNDDVIFSDNVYYYEDGAVEKITDLINDEQDITIKFWDDSVFDSIDLDDLAENLELWDIDNLDDLSEMWEDFHLDNVKKLYEKDGEIDITARRESWNNYLDLLVSDGTISEELGDEGLPDDFEE